MRDFEAELRALACGDTSCRVIAPKGMATNGGCRCGGNRSKHACIDTDQAPKIWDIIAIRRDQVAALTARVAKMEQEKGIHKWQRRP